MGNFYRNLADNINNVLGSDSYGRIASDANLPSEDVQKYILATSDFAKGTQTDINHNVTRDTINDASFRQKLDPISKNIIRRQNPLELVFGDISMFDAESAIVGSLIREIDLNKKQAESDFIKSLPGKPGKKFEIQKRLDKLQDIKNPGRKNNNNNNNNGSLFPPGPGGDFPRGPGRYLFPPRPGQGLPSPPLPPYSEEFEELQGQPNMLRGTSPPLFFASNAPNFHIPAHRDFIESLQQTNHQHQTTYSDLKQLPWPEKTYETETELQKQKLILTIHFISYLKTMN